MISRIDSAIPVGTLPMLAQFNAASGAFVTCLSDIPLEYLNTTHFKYAKVEIDLALEKVVGVYDNFKVVKIADEPTEVYESMVNELCKQKIFKRFAVEVQLDILRNAIAKVLEAAGIEDEALADMNDYIDEVKRANKVIKQSYIDNPDFKFITIKEAQEIEEQRLDGGLHEIMGPKNLIGLGSYTTK